MDVFDDVDVCINYISSCKDDNIFLIVSDIFGETLVQLIHDIKQIKKIYIYCQNSHAYPIWNSAQFEKLSGIFDDEKLLLVMLFEDIDEVKTKELFTPSNSKRTTPVPILKSIVEEWYAEDTPTTATTTQHVLILYDEDLDISHHFEKLTQKLAVFPYMHLEIKHNIQQAYETLSSLPFTCWRAVIDKNMAKEFTLLRAEKMISLYFCVSTVIYAPVYDDQLRWAIDDPVRVWGGVAADEEKILRFCSGDPLTHVQNSMSKFLALDKSDLLRVMNRIVRTKLPFSIVIPESDDPLSDKTIRFDGSKLQPRQARFIAALKPQFVQSLQMSNLAELFSKLLTIENDWIDAVNVRLFLGIMYHAKCNNRPIEHIQNRLIKWLCPSYSVIPDGMNSLHAIRAFTEETFLYRDVNLALANIHEESIYYLRDYIHLCISAFAQMLIPFYAGTVYRGVQMTADEIEEYRVGANIRFLGFMSTTKSFEFVSFLGTNVIFIIHTLSDKHQRRLGRYTNADLHISNVTVMPSEEEVLYAPFSSFQIIQIEKSEDDRVTFISLMENDTSAADHVHLQIMQSQVDKGIAKDAYFSPSIISLVSDNDGNMMKQELSKAKDLPVHMRMSIPYKMWMGDE